MSLAFAALTTGTALGSFALSHHPGTASMGALLMLSLACMVSCSLPDVLNGRPGRPPSGEPPCASSSPSC